MAPGIKTGGRQKGTPNKFTRERQIEIAATGLSPLEYLLAVMRDGLKEDVVRLDAAKAAAPYVHAKLSSIDFTGSVEHDLTDPVLELFARIATQGKRLSVNDE